MARAKYKLGTLIQVDTGTGTEHGTVDAILTHKEGYAYRLEGKDDEFIKEEDITAAFRPVVARKAAPAKKSAAKKAAAPAKRPTAKANSAESSSTVQ